MPPTTYTSNQPETEHGLINQSEDFQPQRRIVRVADIGPVYSCLCDSPDHCVPSRKYFCHHPPWQLIRALKICIFEGHVNRSLTVVCKSWVPRDIFICQANSISFSRVASLLPILVFEILCFFCVELFSSQFHTLKVTQ